MRIGIDIGGNHIGVGLVDDFGKIIIKKENDILVKEKTNIKVEIIENIKRYIIEILKEKNSIKNISMIGIAFPAALHKGKMDKSTNLGIIGEEIKEGLEAYFNIPTYIKNDAKCAAICEKEYGSLNKYKNAVFLTIGTGIGGAVFINNKLVELEDEDIFEVGHMIIKKNGIQCNCGKKGCFEKYASISALKENVKKEFKIEKNITGKELHDFIKENVNDENMKKILNEYLENLLMGIYNIITLFNPNVISIGGSFAYYGDIFGEKLKSIFNDMDSKIILATTKNDAGIIGATRLAI